MRRVLGTLALIALLARSVAAQPPYGPIYVSGQDDGTCTPGAGTCALFPVSALSVVTIDVVSLVGLGMTGTFTFEGTRDGTNWQTVRVTHALTGVTSTTFSAVGTSPPQDLLIGSFNVPVTGLTGLRLRATAWTSGSATVALRTIAASIADHVGFGRPPDRTATLAVQGSVLATNGIASAPTGLSTDLSAFTGTVDPGGLFADVDNVPGLTLVTHANGGGTIYALRTGAVGANNADTVVFNGDYLLTIGGVGADGQAFRQAGQLQLLVDGTPGLNAMPGRWELSTTPAGAGTPALRLTIDNLGNLKYGTAAKLLIAAAAPTISSGFGTTPTVPASNGTSTFTINVGTGGTATSGVIGFPAASTGWRVHCDDVTTQSTTVFLTKQIATTTTTATIANYNTAGAQTAWVASNILVCSAMAY